MQAPPLQTLRLAFFGESGSGKTALVSSYFGYQQRHSFEQTHGYRLNAANTRDGNVLLRNYYGMQEGVFPPQTVSRWYTFQFDLKASGLSRPAVRVEWIDYPGGWWGNVPADLDEQQQRQACILKLLTAQVGILIVDGASYRRHGARYLRALLEHFTAEVRGWQRGLVAGPGGEHITVIENWIVALTKADLFPQDYTAERFAKAVIKETMDELNELGEALYGKPQQFGTRFMLLSAAQGEPNQPQRVASVEHTIGLELLAPAALWIELERLAERRQRHNPAQDLPWWQRLLLIAEELAKGPALRNVVGKRYEPVVDLLHAIGQFARFDVEKQAEELKAEREAAVKEGDALRATALSMLKQVQSATRAYFVTQDAT